MAQEIWKPVVALLVVAGGLVGMLSGGPVKRAPGILVDTEPQQTPATQAPFRFGTFEVAPQADYDIEARVLSVERYRFDGGARLSPIDFAVGWGPMSDSAVLQHFRVTQGARFFTIYPGDGAIDLRLALRSSANMHLVPANGHVEDRLLGVRPGNVVHLKGYLIDVHGDDGYTWNSSLTRDDTGDGACELFWVTQVAKR
jgi:hypothetical protein